MDTSETPAQSTDMDRFKGRVALVTGASTGIGAGICRKLVKCGMTVIGCGREVDAIAAEKERWRASGELYPYQCDLTDEKQILKMFLYIQTVHKKLDVCINNAGFATDTSLMSGDTEGWRQMLNVSIMGLCICTRESIKLMNEEAIIIQIGCIMGHKVPDLQLEQGIPNFGFHYGMKFMVRGLAESLRHELRLGGSKIRVALISPGAVETELFERGFNREAARNFYSRTKCLQPLDIADAVVYILQQPAHVNVQDILVQPRDHQM